MARSLKKIRDIEIGFIEEKDLLSWDATHDHLTNVYNRRWLERKIGLLHEETRSDPKGHSLMCIDLDGFKEINDRFGHKAGDLYLQQFCREVEHVIRQNDTFCRVGGDEFAILLENCNRDIALKVAKELLRRIENFKMTYEGNQLSATCSIGICQFHSDKIEFDQLVQQTDALCYQAKRGGKNRVEISDYRR